MYLFVYGTLKTGFHNNHYLSSADPIGEFKTEPRYRLFSNGYFPMMWEDAKDGYSVLGEIWDIDDDEVPAIDAHEVLYHRALIGIEDIDGLKSALAEPWDDPHKEVDEPEVYGYIYDAWPDEDLQECYSQWPP